MFDLPAIRLGRLFGIPVEVNLSWLLIFGLLTFSLSASLYPSQLPGLPGWAYLVLGAVSALLFFSSIVVHELAHSLVARAGGGNVEKITLFLLGGVAQMDEEPQTPGKEFVMAFAGPATSILIGAVSFLSSAVLFGAGAPDYLWFPLQYLAAVNVFVGAFNMLPGFPLDGGRVLRSVLWALTHDLLKATRWAARVGQFIGWSMVVFAVMRILPPASDSSFIWFGLVGWFIASLAGQAYQQQVLRSRLAAVPVAAAMTRMPETVPGEITLEQLAHEYLLGGRHSRYPVVYRGEVVGLITLPHVKDVPRSHWNHVQVIDVTDRELSRLVVTPDMPLDAVLSRLGADQPGALLVVDAGRLVGILTRADVIAAAQHRLV